MLVVKQLTRSYRDVSAVNNVSFVIKKGEIVGLLGHNGAGKTTIMKMLSGFIESNDGSIEINGVDLKNDPKKAQKNIGYLSENLPVYPEMLVADYLDYVCEIKGIDKSNKISEIKRVIQATDIESKILSQISTLSRGYKQRVGIAQAILGKPKLLILDEPTNGLDPKQTSLVRELIRGLSKNATIILSTHIMQEVDAICSRALILRDGELVVDAELDELKKTNILNLSTSLGQESLSSALVQLSNLSSIKKISEGRNIAIYQLEVNDDKKLDETISEISRLIISSGGDLYSIYKKVVDLETLFREASEFSTNTDKMEA
ncbi:MAG: multidrug ABC transporter ATP-binding protein [Porticoccus sp.]|jgi:ABC-2 type transport system ATP-binding protein|nr:multidrug ABC transporter ATP-binding protein [Porticoccus sp.]|tara:strand:+ start:340 stop:1293 length:954 start_codon:yes stop_codon:yes gene_type:complete